MFENGAFEKLAVVVALSALAGCNGLQEARSGPTKSVSASVHGVLQHSEDIPQIHISPETGDAAPTRVDQPKCEESPFVQSESGSQPAADEIRCNLSFSVFVPAPGLAQAATGSSSIQVWFKKGEKFDPRYFGYTPGGLTIDTGLCLKAVAWEFEGRMTMAVQVYQFDANGRKQYVVDASSEVSNARPDEVPFQASLLATNPEASAGDSYSEFNLKRLNTLAPGTHFLQAQATCIK